MFRMNDFARKQLLKYGWKEGKGLGKNESGITAAIKPSLKFNNYGIGHDVSKQYTSRWWDFAFNKAANSISVVNSETGVSIKRKKKKKDKNGESKKSKSKLEMNGSFLKAGLLTSDGEISTVLPNSIDEDESLEFSTKETDEELFMRCGGRTAHKAARYGLKMNGKLRRIEEQEESFIKNCRLNNSEEKQMCIDSLTDYSSLKCKPKNDAKICNNADVSTNNENSKKKRKKRQHKSKESI